MCVFVCVCVDAHHLVQDVFVEVRHVALAGDWTVIIIPEVFLQSHRIMRDTQDGTQVMGQDLETHNT